MSRPVEFWSSTGAAAFQRALMEELARAGWPTEQCFEVSQGDYWAARSRFARLALRARAYALYPLRVAGRFAFARRDRIHVVCTNTFYAPWIAGVAARRDVPLIHWVFDLYPDVLLAAGKLRAGGAGERVLRGMVRATFDRAHANVFLGEHLLRHAEANFGAIPRAHVIPVGADGRPFRDTPPAPAARGAPVRILYSGILGRMHEVDTLAAALTSGLPNGVRVDFRGSGAEFTGLQRRAASAGLRGVTFAGNLPDEEWARTMRAADIALVTMRRGAEGLVMPSKSYSALVAGQAILALCPRESDLAALVRECEAGWVIEPGDPAGLTALLQRLPAMREEIQAKRANAWRAGHTRFDQPVLARQWMAVLEAVAAPN